MGSFSSLNPKLGLDKRVSFCIRFKYNAAYWFTPHGSLSCGFIAWRFTGPSHSELALVDWNNWNTSHWSRKCTAGFPTGQVSRDIVSIPSSPVTPA